MATQNNKTISWIALYFVAGTIDIAQIILDLTGVGIAVSEALEVATPFILIGLMALFRIPIFSGWKRIASLAFADFADALTGGAAPFWILDVWYIHRDVRREDAGMAVTEGQTISSRAPLNVDGRREPLQQESAGLSPKPLNVDGVRAPTNGAISVQSMNYLPESEEKTTEAKESSPSNSLPSIDSASASPAGNGGAAPGAGAGVQSNGSASQGK